MTVMIMAITPSLNASNRCLLNQIAPVSAYARRADLDVIDGGRYTRFARAVGATKILAPRLDAMANDLAAAMIARRGDLLNRAFKAVKDMTAAANDDFKRPLIVVPADFTLCHGYPSRSAAFSRGV
jgi:hypothetical protein